MFVQYLFELISLGCVGIPIVAVATAITQRADRTIHNFSREEVLRRTLQEIDQLYAWYDTVCSRDTATCIGCCYARYSTDKQDSVPAQVRKILEHSIGLRVYVPREHVFFDIAVSGKKGQRAGLTKLETSLREKKSHALILFGTNRLFRKSWRTLQFAERVHQNWGARIVFIAQGIDTDDKRWELSLHAQAMVDQFVVTMYGDNIRAAHEQLFERRLVFGNISYGYDGEPIAGEFSRTGKQRRRLVIDDTTARVVRLIFALFVNDRLGLNEIARRLNDDPSIPLPRRCRSGAWSDVTVRYVLTNARYRGYWQYGATESIYNSEADYVGKVTRLEPLKAAQIEELRIIEDDLWFAAAELIAKHGNGNAGRKSIDGDFISRPKTLNGLLFCEAHERPLVVSGAYGRHLVCPICQVLPKNKRSLTSWLNRQLSLRLLCDELARRILDDNELVEQTIDACRQAAAGYQPHSSINENGLKSSLRKISSAINFTLRCPGETTDEHANSMKVLRELRMEKAKLEAELRGLHARRKMKPKVPTEKEVRKLLKELASQLALAGQSADASEQAILRKLVEELTGGRIIISQHGDRERQRGWLTGTFHLHLLNTVINRVSDNKVTWMDTTAPVSIDFKRPLAIDGQADIAWQMNQDKQRHSDIGKVLNCCGGYVSKLLKYYARKNNLKWIDGRSQRKDFPHLNRQPALFKRLVDKVMELYQRDLLEDEIADELDVDRTTVRKAIRWYHEQNGLRVPDGRTRAGRIKYDRNRRKDSQ